MKCSFLKRWVERTRLAPVYRAAREEWRFSDLRFAETPFGFKLAGPKTMQTGEFEAAEVELVKHHLRSADVFVDVGANVGYFTCLARSMGKQVVAVEPHWGNLRYLYANLQVNGWAEGVDIYPMGLSDKPGLAWLYGGGTDASLLSGWSGASEAFKRTIPVTTLDTLLGDRFAERRVMVKVDVEGAEYTVFRGAPETLRAIPRPLWLVEITLSEHRQGRRNAHFLPTFELFWDLGYEATAVGPNGKTVTRTEISAYADGGDRPSWATGNYLFAPKDVEA